MKVKSLVDIYIDERHAVAEGQTLTVDYVDAFKKMVVLLDGKNKDVRVSIEVFINFFK